LFLALSRLRGRGLGEGLLLDPYRHHGGEEEDLHRSD
jgi:hypothetical protein